MTNTTGSKLKVTSCGWTHAMLCVLVGGLAAPVMTATAQGRTATLTLPFEIGRLEVPTEPAAHPRVFFSGEETQAARRRVERDPAARAILDRFLADVREHLELTIEPIDETWWQEAKNKPWDETYPEVFMNTFRIPWRYGYAAGELATAWLLTGEEEYARTAEDMLMNLVDYSFEPEHYDVGMNYAIWAMHALKAYDILMPRLAPDRRRAVDAMMTRMADAVARNDLYWIRYDIGGGINNHLAWHKMILGLLGLFYDRPEMTAFCLDGPRGLVPLLEDGLLDDGLWIESSLVYQFTAIAPMLVFADCQRRVGDEPCLLDLTAANGRTLKQSFDAMFNVLAPDGMIPPIGDAYGARRRLWDLPIYDIAWKAWGDPRYAWVLNRAEKPALPLLFAPPVPADAPPPAVRTILLPEHGYAFLRSHHDEAYWGDEAWCAFLTFDRSDVHANADKLSLMLFGQGRMLLSDVEGRATVPHAFSARIQRELNRGALSQNTVMIDGRDQRYHPDLLRLIEFRDLPEEKRVTAADLDGQLYDGVRQMRTVAMTPDYILDVFQVDTGETPRQIDWIIHVMDENATAPPDRNPAIERAEPFQLPETGPWTWLRDAVSYVPDGPVTFDWTDGEARLRLHMLDPGAERVILCGYPATDEPDTDTIPMVMVRRRAATAVFAAVWLIGERPADVTLRRLEPRDDKLFFEVTADGHARRHWLPALAETTAP